MTLIPEVRVEIHATARRRASATAAGHSARNRWRSTIGSLTVAASVLVVAGVVAVILLHAYRNSTVTAGQHLRAFLGSTGRR
jgi:anti-sigma-K factor RskA